MNTCVILRRSGWSSRNELDQAAGRSARVGRSEMPALVRWIRSYVTAEASDRIGTACINPAVDPDAIREPARRAELPCESIIPVADTVIINDDPLVAA